MPVIEEAAPAGHYYAQMRGRRMLIKNINSAQSMVLSGYFRKADGPVTWEILMGIYANVMLLLDSLIVDKADMAWIEQQIMSGQLVLEDLAGVFSAHETVEVKPAPKKPHRGK